jgi:hypothetical protein
LDAADLLDGWERSAHLRDQFEELFRWDEKSSRAAQEDALRFARLLVVAAEQTEVRLHILLSMRSEFIGGCERFPGLSELVSRSQFLTPRLSRKQLEQSLGCPALTVGWKIAPDALTAILNDCGNSPDQLPLAQHVLRRMWMRAEQAGRTELTLDDYTTFGGIHGSIAQHGREILRSLLEVDEQTLTALLASRQIPTIALSPTLPPVLEVARILFMAVTEQREEGPLVRRLSTQEEVEAIAGNRSALVPQVIAAFAGDDPGFIREEKGWLDVRHEAVLRQWPWWLNGAAAKPSPRVGCATFRMPRRTLKRCSRRRLLARQDLRRANTWLQREQPSEAWAIRHSVRNWEQCLRFLKTSRKKRYKNWVIRTVAFGIVVLPFIWVAGRSVIAEGRAAAAAADASAARLKVIEAFAQNRRRSCHAHRRSTQSALSNAEQQKEKLIFKIEAAATEAPPDDAEIEDLEWTRRAAREATDALGKLAQSIARSGDYLE